jgi:choline dehydrogenase-like flavoprotein
VAQNADGRLEVFAGRPDGRLGHVWQLDPGGRRGWSGWEDLGPLTSGTPTVVQNADGRLEVFAGRPDGRLGHVWQLDPGGRRGWSDWEDLGPAAVGSRVAVCPARSSTESQLDDPKNVARRRSAPLRTSSVLTADVCVIGAGPAGITITEGLLRAGASVVLADSGGLEEDPAAQELNHGFADGPVIKRYSRYLRDGRRRQVQGSASGWGRGWCLPFRALDLEHRPWVMHSGWPLTPADLAPYEARAAATFGFDAFDPPRPDGPLTRLTYHYPPDPLVFRATFSKLVGRPRFRPELGATAVELAVRGDRVESVRFARSDGGELRVSAGTVVLATGAIENARLLLLHERALPTGNAMVGRCFMEHPHALAGNIQLPDAAPLRACLEEGEQLDVIALGDAAQYQERLLNASVQLRPRDRDVLEGPVECDLYVRAEQAPNPESRLLLADRRDRLGSPWPALQWRLLDEDWTSIVRTATLVASELEDRHDATVRLSIHSDAPWPWAPAGPADDPNATWGNHHLGTTRMARRAEDGVVDPNCLLHGTRNLYIAGSSVFPTGGCANPTFMIVALAHRLADHLSAAAAG